MRSFLIWEELFSVFILTGTSRSDKPRGRGYFGASAQLPARGQTLPRMQPLRNI